MVLLSRFLALKLRKPRPFGKLVSLVTTLQPFAVVRGRAGVLAPGWAGRRLIELTSSEVVFKAAVGDETAGQSRHRHDGRNCGPLRRRSMVV